MKQRLADRESEFVKNLNPDDLAKRCHAQLIELVKSFEFNKLNAKNDTAVELIELEQAWINNAITLLPILATEQFRQREAIKLYLHGRIDIADLRRISDTWNGKQ